MQDSKVQNLLDNSKQITQNQIKNDDEKEIKDDKKYKEIILDVRNKIRTIRYIEALSHFIVEDC